MTDIALAAPEELSVEAVRKRFADARRKGLSSWLWPDIAVQDWRAAMADIAEVTRQMLAGASGCALRHTDPRAVGLAAYTSGMGPLLGYWIEQGKIGAAPAVEDTLHIHLAHNRRRNMRLAGIAGQVAERMHQAGIAPVFLKGIHTALTYFPEQGVRPLTDIDLYLPPASIAPAEKIFRELGYSRLRVMRRPYMCDWSLSGMRRQPRTLTHVHQDDPWSVDVQDTLSRLYPTGVKVELDRLLPGTGFSPWPGSQAARVLGQPLLALHLAAHLSQYLISVTLIRLMEFVLVLRRDTANGSLRWDDFLAGAERIGGGHLVYPALHFCEEIAPGTVPAHVRAACGRNIPPNLRATLAKLSPATAMPLGRHSAGERFMWASRRRDYVAQLLLELGMDLRGRRLRTTLYHYGTKFWALYRGRLTR